MYNCSNCTLEGCAKANLEKTMPICPSKNSLQDEIRPYYDDDENLRIARAAAITEANGYGRDTRVEEMINFFKHGEYKKIGLAFCLGLDKEAREFTHILEHHGFEVVSVICKNGAIPKSHIGLTEDQTISGKTREIMCNPIGQALLLNEAQTEFNVMLGLCVGHDTLAMKYMEAPVTVLAVKDRITCHNPLAPIYSAQGYYKKRLYPKK